MSKYLILAWIVPLVFMLASFYLLFQSHAPVVAKVVFTVLPLLIWIIGGITIFRRYRFEMEVKQKQEEIIKEVKRILQSNQHSEESRGQQGK